MYQWSISLSHTHACTRTHTHAFTRTHSHTPFSCLTILPLPLYSHIFHPLFSNCLFSVFFPQLFVEKKKNFCCLLLNSLSVNTAGSSAFNGRPEGQALGSAEPEALCVYQTVMVTVAFLKYFQLDFMTSLLCEWLINDFDLTWLDGTVWVCMCVFYTTLKRLINSFSLHDWTIYFTPTVNCLLFTSKAGRN